MTPQNERRFYFLLFFWSGLQPAAGVLTSTRLQLLLLPGETAGPTNWSYTSEQTVASWFGGANRREEKREAGFVMTQRDAESTQIVPPRAVKRRKQEASVGFGSVRARRRSIVHVSNGGLRDGTLRRFTCAIPSGPPHNFPFLPFLKM